MLSRPIYGTLDKHAGLGARVSVREAFFWVGAVSLLLWSTVAVAVLRLL